MYTAYIGLGSNLGDRPGRLNEAVVRIARFGRVTAAARVYETAPVGFVSRHLFLNTAVAVATGDDPGRLLRRLKRVERAMGRPPGTHLKDRIIDLDILMYEDLYYVAPGVEVPHPALEARRFALAPLNDIAARVVHPLAGRRVRTLLEHCSDRSGMRVTDVILHLPS